ncbi:MAG TPA: site-specific DNA-methyltransferase [Phycisphaerales bacterium]|nr:site-specific DNA-methyltransferase [Phycisphaerales bacterium]
MSETQIIQGDCLEVMDSLPIGSVNLVFGSPSYEDARTYGMDFALTGQDWVDWMVEVFKASLRVCSGLVAFVVEGRTRAFRYSATPLLLAADLHRAGIHLRNPPVFHRNGIPGSGRSDWLRNDYEFIICGTNGGELPWSDNTAMGHTPKCAVGGEMSYRNQDGRRKNQRHRKNKTPSQKQRANGVSGNPGYEPPKIANPGNVITLKVGGGHMGSKLNSENEAPFPEKLAEFFIRSFCPEGGTVLDPFSGSGTTAAVANRFGRNAVAIDIRQSQCELTQKRVDSVKEESALLD